MLTLKYVKHKKKKEKKPLTKQVNLKGTTGGSNNVSKEMLSTGQMVLSGG